ncbi:MAG: helix-turn-helix domain-containing protein [Solirubrobacterales bacterium]
MTRRRYDQACSIAGALDRVGERWSMLVVRELLLGPLRFSDLARAVGGAPTDVLTKRLRDLEADRIVHRVELGPPSGVTVYELTELGRGLEGPLLALGRWGLNFYRLEDIVGIGAFSLSGPLKVVLDPPPTLTVALQMRSEGAPTWLRVEAGEVSAGRGELEDPDLVLTGPPAAILLALAPGGDAAPVEIEGDRELLEALRSAADLPERLAEEVAAATSQLSSVPS